jgi:hypothetical protein
MGLFFALLWCALLTGCGSGLGIVSASPGNLRLALRKFPSCSDMGFHRQPSDQAYSFSRSNGDSMEQWRNSRFDGNNRECCTIDLIER